ncbi:MAG TPA: hypothetical protein VHW43_04530, partial [Puia sp.]|nr:hypothetical protein [Puia sp.]
MSGTIVMRIPTLSVEDQMQKISEIKFVFLAPVTVVKENTKCRDWSFPAREKRKRRRRKRCGRKARPSLVMAQGKMTQSNGRIAPPAVEGKEGRYTPRQKEPNLDTRGVKNINFKFYQYLGH